MAYDEGLAEQMREDLGDLPGAQEKKMFGGLCFMSRGNMVCGVHRNGAMYRVGKAHYDAALALPGVRPMAFTGREMKGFVEADDEVLADDTLRLQLIAMARDFAATLPPK